MSLHLVFLPVQKSTNNQTWQYSRPACTDVSQQVAMLPPSLGHLKDIWYPYFHNLDNKKTW